MDAFTPVLDDIELGLRQIQLSATNTWLNDDCDSTAEVLLVCLCLVMKEFR